MMLTAEQIKDAGWTHGEHCDCQRCDRRRDVMLEALEAYQRVERLLNTEGNISRTQLAHALYGEA